jgi:DUF1680 family protein
MELRARATIPLLLLKLGWLIPLAAQSRESPRLSAPDHGLEEVDSRVVKLEGGFWGPRLEIHQHTTIPHVLDKLEERHHLRNFDVAARVVNGGGATQGSTGTGNTIDPLAGDTRENEARAAEGNKSPSDEIVGHSAFDSDVHKALEGACHTLGCKHDPALRQRVESMLDRIVAAQETDGYLVSSFIAKEPEKKWADMRTGHEMYNAGHLFEFAVAHHQLDGGTKALDAAKRFADHIDRTFGPGKRYEVCGHQGIELALVKLYRATGEKRYLDLCRFLVDERGHAHGTGRKPFVPVPFVEPEREPGLTDYEFSRVVWRAKLYWRNGRMQDHKPLLEQTEAVGHAVRASYIYAAMTDLARFSDAPEYAEAVRILWEDVVRRKMHLTGGIGTAQYGDEGFGDPYRLPNKTYCESCAGIGSVLWQHRLNLLDADTKYADVMELTLYNSAIAGMSLSGDAFFYQNPLESRQGATRTEWIGLACCPTNHARLTPQVGSLVYARDQEKLHVNLFAAGRGTIDMGSLGKVTVHQETRYPWDGKIKLTVTPEKSAAIDLRLRIPGWARGHTVPGDLYRDQPSEPSAVTLTINGEALEATPGKDGYVSIKRTWKPGDVVDLNLPMPLRRIHSHPNLEENRGRVALMRGPLVYCFEGIDQPGADLFKVTLPPDAELAAEHRPDFLHGVTVVKTTGLDEDGKPVALTGIPYFAWANREKTPMNLWLRETK